MADNVTAYVERSRSEVRQHLKRAGLQCLESAVESDPNAIRPALAEIRILERLIERYLALHERLSAAVAAPSHPLPFRAAAAEEQP